MIQEENSQRREIHRNNDILVENDLSLGNKFFKKYFKCLFIYMPINNN